MVWWQVPPKQIIWPERCFIGPCTTTTIDASRLLFLSLLMISRRTRKARQDNRSSPPSVELFHSLGKLKVDLCWQQKGFGISSTRHARDLGVDVSFGGRSVPSARKRAKRALIKARRIRSPTPELVWSQIWCIPPTSMKRLRAAAAWISREYRAGMCTTTLLSITKAGPSRLHAEVITEYLVFLRDHPCKPGELNVPGSCYSDASREHQ